MAEILFVTSVVVIAYAYLGYPVVLAVLSRALGQGVRKADIMPKVSLIVAAYNEEGDIANKIKNALALDYPEDKLEVIVTSDCSTDRTDEIVREFQGRVMLYRLPHRLGKTAAQNRAVSISTGEILVFSDATTNYHPLAVRNMVRNFADPSVGCVAGRLVYKKPVEGSVGSGCISYWSYETFLKSHESRVSSLIGVSGCMYAVRHSSYAGLDRDLSSDFVIAAEMRLLSLRTVFEPEAVCYEDTNIRPTDEFRMRVRVIEQTITALSRYRELLDPRHHGLFALQMLSHKVARYLIPWLLILAFLANLAWLNSFPEASIALILQVGFYTSAGCGLILDRFGVHHRVLAMPYYFVLANGAAALGLVKFLLGKSHIVWEPVREARQE